MAKQKIISIVGLTSSGKSDLGIKIAQRFNGEIISCDSRQIYKGLDESSGKVTKQEQAIVPHHMLDIINPGENFSAYDFQQMAFAIIDDIISRGKTPILVGGTGLYTRAILQNFSFQHDPDQDDPGCNTENPLLEISYLPEKSLFYNKLQNNELVGAVRNAPQGRGLTPEENAPRNSRHSNTPHENFQNNEPRYDYLQICLSPSQEEIRDKITRRSKNRLNDGMVAEIKTILDGGVDPDWMRALGFEYKLGVDLIRGDITAEEYWHWFPIRCAQYAKRQRTWYKKELNTTYLDDVANFERDAAELIIDFLATS